MSSDRENLENRIAVFQRLLDHPVAFHRIFFDLTESVKAALMASQAHYWCRREVALARDGWFYKTQTEWEEEVCLTRREQESARELLRKAGFWFEKLIGNPAQLWFRIDYSLLLSAIENGSFVQSQDGVSVPAKDGEKVPAKETETTAENTTETTTESAPVRPFLHKPEKREKAKKAKPKTWASSGFSNSRSLDEFPTAGRPRHENSRFVPNKQAEALYTLIRTEVQERGDRSPGGMTGPMQERWGELYETHGPEILEKAFWLWWDREGTSLPEDFSRPIALFLKDATGCIAEAAAKRKKPKSEYVSAIDNIPPPPKPTYNHSWEKKYAKQKLSGE
jgi:hypothetical protein